MRWSLFKDRSWWTIRRWNGSKYERHPRAKFKHLDNDESALQEYVKRLNVPYDTKVAVDYKHAFISVGLLEEYLDWLLAQFPTRQQDAKCEFYYLKTHFLNFFIVEKRINDPAKWFDHSETAWANYLMSDKVPRGTNTKKQIVVAANRFMGWLHKKRPTEIPKERLKPISARVYRNWNEQRKIDGETRLRSHIPDSDWAKIKARLPESGIEPFVMLGYCYGIRRGEALGVKPGDVKAKTLTIARQLGSLSPLKFKPVKGVWAREVPHWFATNVDAYRWVEHASKARMNPKTLWEKWDRLMKSLGMNYDFHDLRHTFITNAMATQPIPRAVQEAAGHKDIATTMGYSHVKTINDNPEFKPDGAA